MSGKKPNILCIYSDEHTWNIAGCYGDPVVKTPNLDKIADGGVLFTNCYTPSPLCVPARLAFTAGQYVSKCGAYNNDCDLPSDDYPSLFHLLNSQGYECALGGKMHYSGDKRYGFTVDLNPKWNDGKKHGRHTRVDVDSDSFKNPPNPPKLSNRYNEFRVANESGILNHDRKVTELCGEYIKGRKKDDKPFFLLAGYLAPHFPIIIPEEYDAYKGKVSMPVIPEGLIENLPMNYKVLRRAFQMEDVPADIVKRGRELYYGFVSWLDNEIGKLIASLNDSEAADNTIIIYTTDHGENLGEHGMWWKNNMYDHSARIPCIINFPDKRKAGSRITKACSMLDLTQTIAEISGGRAPDNWDGRSLMGLIEGSDSEWPDIAVSEYYAHNIASGHCMIRHGKYKYVYFNKINDVYPAEKQLFDIEADPGELNDLSGRAEYAGLMGELHAMMKKELGRDPEEVEAEIRAKMAQANLR